jgi:hypothetical protein
VYVEENATFGREESIHLVMSAVELSTTDLTGSQAIFWVYAPALVAVSVTMFSYLR